MYEPRNCGCWHAVPISYAVLFPQTAPQIVRARVRVINFRAVPCAHLDSGCTPARPWYLRGSNLREVVGSCAVPTHSLLSPPMATPQSLEGSSVLFERDRWASPLPSRPQTLVQFGRLHDRSLRLARPRHLNPRITSGQGCVVYLLTLTNLRGVTTVRKSNRDSPAGDSQRPVISGVSVKAKALIATCVPNVEHCEPAKPDGTRRDHFNFAHRLRPTRPKHRG